MRVQLVARDLPKTVAPTSSRVPPRGVYWCAPDDSGRRENGLFREEGLCSVDELSRPVARLRGDTGDDCMR